MKPSQPSQLTQTDLIVSHHHTPSLLIVFFIAFIATKYTCAHLFQASLAQMLSDSFISLI